MTDFGGTHVPGPSPEAAVYVISVAAQLTGLHPQTLRTYERIGLVTPGRAGGGGRRYSARDLEQLRSSAQLTAAGIGLVGVRRIVDLERQVSALRQVNAELAAELDATRAALQEALREAVTARRTPDSLGSRNKLPMLREVTSSQSVVVWRRPSR
ncbi:MAG: heat shock protein transcriptional repressor HspR [Nocardioides sp.]